MKIFNKEIPIQIIRLSIIALVIASIVAFKIISSNMINAKIDKILGSAKGYITYGDTSMDLFGFDAHIYDIKLNIPNQKPLIVDEMIVKSLDTDNAMPHYMNIKLKGIQSDLAMLRSNPNLADKLNTLEIKNIDSGLVINYEFEKDEKMLNIKEFTLKLEDAGKISYKAKIYNVVAMEYFPMQVNLAPQTLKFGTTSLHYEDDSFMERLTKLNAQDANQSVEIYKDERLKRITAKLNAAKAASQNYEIALDEAMLTFLENPKSFEFSIDPKVPISLSILGQTKSRDDVLKTLNLEVSAN
jgi:hypothetical protein